jgi:hypothetical protein
MSTSHTADVFNGFAERAGSTVDETLAGRAPTTTLLKSLPTSTRSRIFA